MAEILALVYATRNPNGSTTEYPDGQTMLIVSDKIVGVPITDPSEPDGSGSRLYANGWSFDVSPELAEIATAISADDITATT